MKCLGLPGCLLVLSAVWPRMELHADELHPWPGPPAKVEPKEPDKPTESKPAPAPPKRAPAKPAPPTDDPKKEERENCLADADQFENDGLEACKEPAALPADSDCEGKVKRGANKKRRQCRGLE